MKRLLLIALLSSGVFGFAQSNGVGDGTIRYGISVKAHQSYVRGIHNKSIGRTAGAAGVFLEIPFAQRMSSNTFVVPMVEYSMEGEDANPSTGRQQFHNSYVNGLVYIKHFISFNSFSDPKLFLMLGPKIGYMVSDKTSGEITRPHIVLSEINKNKWSAGISAGAGYRFSRSMEGYVRYDNGFTPVYENYDKGNFNYQFGLGANILFR